MSDRVTRPVFLNLLRIHLPVTAVLSIVHRFSGVLLSLLIPAVIYLLHLSLKGPEQYREVISLLSRYPTRLAMLFILWALVHHALAGVRYLLIDLDIGVTLHAARVSAWVVNLASVVALMLIAAVLL